MANYNIEFTKYDKYSAVIYSTSYVNPFESIEDITADIKKDLAGEGYILFDLLLSNGDCFNRFTEAYYDGHEIKSDSISIVSFDDKKILNTHYRGRTHELNNSVLTPREIYIFAK